jgi:hypothetical protein
MKSSDSMKKLIFTYLYDSIQVDNIFVVVSQKRKNQRWEEGTRRTGRWRGLEEQLENRKM